MWSSRGDVTRSTQSSARRAISFSANLGRAALTRTHALHTQPTATNFATDFPFPSLPRRGTGRKFLVAEAGDKKFGV